MANIRALGNSIRTCDVVLDMHTQHCPSRIRRALVPVVAVLALGAGAGLSACGGDDDAPVSDPAATDSVDVDDVPDFDESIIVGLSFDEAAEAAEAEGFVLRIAIEDGEDQVLTMDFVTNRVNVEVDDGTVVRVVSQG